jgi:hypothetical protein
MEDNYSLKNDNSYENLNYNKKFEINTDFNQQKYQLSPPYKKREQSSNINSSNNNYKKKLYLIDKNSEKNEEFNLNLENSEIQNNNNNYSKQIINDLDDYNHFNTERQVQTQEENLPQSRTKQSHISSNSNLINQNNYISSNTENNNNQIFEKHQMLQQKYNTLKEKFKERCEVSEYWRRNYFNLLKDSLTFEETIMQLTEENRIHLEYIISLENKINKILQVTNNITNSFHQNLMNFLRNDNASQGFNINTTNLMTNNNNDLNHSNISNNKNIGLNNAYYKNFTETLNDYKKQLEILAEEKETLNTNLSISRHQQLQVNLKVEELQSRVVNLEKARFQDLKILETEQK